MSALTTGVTRNFLVGSSEDIMSFSNFHKLLSISSFLLFAFFWIHRFVALEAPPRLLDFAWSVLMYVREFEFRRYLWLRVQAESQLVWEYNSRVVEDAEGVRPSSFSDRKFGVTGVWSVALTKCSSSEASTVFLMNNLIARLEIYIFLAWNFFRNSFWVQIDQVRCPSCIWDNRPWIMIYISLNNWSYEKLPCWLIWRYHVFFKFSQAP